MQMFCPYALQGKPCAAENVPRNCSQRAALRCVALPLVLMPFSYIHPVSQLLAARYALLWPAVMPEAAL